MSQTITLERLEARAYATMADASLARDLLKHPRAPRTAERAWRVVSNLTLFTAYAEPESLELLGLQHLPVIAGLFQVTYNNARKMLATATRQGATSQQWFHPLSEAVEALGDALEGLYLAGDQDFRAIVSEAIKELDATGASQEDIPDWRASLAKMPD